MDGWMRSSGPVTAVLSLLVSACSSGERVSEPLGQTQLAHSFIIEGETCCTRFDDCNDANPQSPNPECWAGHRPTFSLACGPSGGGCIEGPIPPQPCDPVIVPDSREDVPGNGIDDDCDGVVDDLLPTQGALAPLVFDPARSLFLSPVDNPVFTAPYPVGGGRIVTTDPGHYLLNRFELFFEESLVTAGDGTVARTGQLLRPWPSTDSSEVFSAGAAGFETRTYGMHGALLGLGVTEVSSRQERTRIAPQFPDGTLESLPLSAPTQVSLFPDTLVVPVTAIVVIPDYDVGFKDEMEALARVEFQKLLWDDIWNVTVSTSSGPLGLPSTVTGTKVDVSVPQSSLNHLLHRAGQHVEPDSVWAQCGIQFRLVDVVPLHVPREVDRPNMPGWKWLPAEFLRRQSCTPEGGCGVDGFVGVAGACVNGTCSNEVGICDNFEQEALLEALIDRARALGPRTDLFGNPIPNGIHNFTAHVVFNSTIKTFLRRTMCSGSAEDGHGASTGAFASVGLQASGFVLAHELGHRLGLNDATTSCGIAGVPPGDMRHLMCGTVDNMGAHIRGCQSWSDPSEQPANPLFNCQADPTESAAQCGVARSAAETVQNQFFTCSAGGSVPEFTFVPDDVTVDDCGPVDLGQAEAEDVCELEEVNVTNDAPATFGIGTTLVTWTATTPDGNSVTATQAVTVTDETAPEFSLVPNDVATTACVGPALGQAFAADSCGGNVGVTHNAPAKFPLGTTLVTWTISDGRGNSRTATQSVAVSLGNDIACCPAGTNVIQGSSNNDTLNGTSGSDCILGRGAQDTINGNGGNDFISGGDGNDTLSGGDGGDLLFGGSGQDTINGNNGNDRAEGGDGDDNLLGGIGDDTLRGGQGQDTLQGQDGNDTLFGDTGHDNLQGGGGNDTLAGAGGNDTCSGGTGTNVFEQCEFGAPNSCSDSAKNGTETATDCGGGCTSCSEELACTSGADCRTNVCSAGVCRTLPGGIAARVVIDADWGGGYCVRFEVTNVADAATTDWSLSFGTNASTIYDSWEGSFSSNSGTVTLTPATDHRILAPDETNGSIGFCANRQSPSSGVVPTLLGATGVY